VGVLQLGLRQIRGECLSRDTSSIYHAWKKTTLKTLSFRLILRVWDGFRMIFWVFKCFTMRGIRYIQKALRVFALIFLSFRAMIYGELLVSVMFFFLPAGEERLRALLPASQ